MTALNAADHGWVLERRPQGDTSLVLRLFTLRQGRIDVLAKGGRKKRELQPFQPLWVEVGGRASLPLLKKAEASGRALALSGERLWCAFYINELLLRLLPGSEASVDLFAAYGRLLEEMSVTQELEPLLRRFEWLLLNDSGYAVALSQDMHGRPLQAGCLYRLQPTGLEVTRDGLPGAHLLAWQQGDWDADIALTIKRLLRQLLAGPLGPKPLQSREMFRAMRRTGSRKQDKS